MSFVPLEANPESFNPYAAELGLDLSKFRFVDVLGLDDELLGLIPQPIEAAILLYPTPDDLEISRRASVSQDESLKLDDLVYFRQKVPNQCGTIALLHVLANSPSIDLQNGHMKHLFQMCKGRNGEESAAILATSDIGELHVIASHAGQSTVPNAGFHAGNAFVAFVAHEGHLIELDGHGRRGPYSHGPLEADLLRSVVNVVKQLIADRDSIKFSLMVLVPCSESG